jgi:putative PEP-CTERM system TPR-repeat lipoprotein
LRCALAFCLITLLSACGGKSPDELLAEAKALHAKGEGNAAILQLKSSIQENAGHAESRLFLGLLYSEFGDFAGAEKELRRAMDLKVDPARVRPALGRALIMVGESKKVLVEIKPEDIKDPVALAGIYSMRGLAHLALRQPTEARTAFVRALEAKPGYTDALLGQARLFASERQLDDALKLVNQALLGAPQSAEGLMLHGDLLRASGRVEDAGVAYQKALDAHPNHANASLALVSLRVADGKYDEAEKHLAVIRKSSPGNPMATYFKALIDFRKRDFPAARDGIQVVLRTSPDHLPSVLLGGAIDFALGSHEQAQARLKYVMERAPKNLYARRLLTASYARTGQTHKAMELLDPVLRQGVKDPTLLALAGEVHMQMNDYDKAKSFFESAAALDPKSAAMRTGLGLSRLAAGEVDLATADLESAAQLDTSRHDADVLLISTHLQRRHFDRALKAARSLAQKQPDNPMSHNLLAAAHLGKKDIVAARGSLEKALELQPTYTPAAANLAQLDLQTGDKQSARKRFEDIILKDRKNVQAYIALATLGPRIDATLQETRVWLESARKESPGTIQPLVMLAHFYLQSNEPKKALAVVEQAVVAAPDNPEVLDLAGQVQLAAGEKNRALATFSKWVAAQPKSATALFRMATAQVANENAIGAINSLHRALAIRAEFPEAQVLLAETEARVGRGGEALKVAAQMQQQDSKSPMGWLVEGDVQMQEKKFAAAARAYEKAYSLARSGPTAIKLYAALAQERRAAEGEARLREWLKEQPTDLATRLYLAEAYLKGAKYKNAIVEYEFLLAKSPDNLVVLNNLAWCYQQVKDKRAVETAEKALNLNPENPDVIDTLGWIVVESGDVRKGVELLRKAASLAPKSPEIRYHYAQSLAKIGNRPAAKEEFEKLLFDFPKLPWRPDIVDRLSAIRAQS